MEVHTATHTALVVDDNATIRLTARKQLEKLG